MASETVMISRRTFHQVAGACVTLTILGCDRRDAPASASTKPGKPAEVPTAPFTVGPVEQFRKPGVYDPFARTHRLWLVSDGRRLLALLNVCTHAGCAIDWKDKEHIWSCPCHRSTFDLQGRPAAGDKAKRPLERLALALVTEQGQPVIRIDPNHRFDEPEWNEPGAFLDLPSP
ncbi:MAG: Rieske 2Fe-2S domain-containing protein [Phycisphaeraceae bacterium]|nr:Rieske 2Fe-2S domain-containing protein [Phycisphaeraceae bacterium]